MPRQACPMRARVEMVGTAGFEPTTLCPPGRCATRLRYAPTSGKLYRAAMRPVAVAAWSPAREALPAQQLQDFFQFHAHLAHDLRAQRGLLLRALALQPQARATDGVALLIEQAADLAH